MPRSSRPPPRTASLDPAALRAIGDLAPVLDAPEIRDVLVQVEAGVARLWIDRDGSLRRVDDWAAPVDAVRRMAVALIAAGGRHLDELNPCADVRVGDGIRVHAVLPPVASHGPAVSIRLPRPRPLSFAELVAGGLCGPRTAEWLRAAVLRRENVLVTGGTGTGKTTLLAALMDLAPPGERIITIEDVAELRLSHPHRVALETRQPNIEGAGGVGLEALLREALRMRPDRIVLGECRGPEIATLLAALNTGHDGSAGTMHASRIDDVPARLEALGALAGLPPPALARQACAGLQVIVHLERTPRGHRLAGIGRLAMSAGGELAIEAVR